MEYINNRLEANTRIFGPRGDQPPLEHHRFSMKVVGSVSHNGDHLTGGNVVAGFLVKMSRNNLKQL